MSKSRFILLTLILALSSIFALPLTHADEGCIPGLTLNDAMLFQEDGKLDSALSVYSCLINQDTENARLYNLRGNVYRDSLAYDAALADYSQSIELDNHVAIVYNNRGWIYYQKGNYQAALSDFNYALVLDSNLAYAYNNRGLVYHSMAEFDFALADFNKAIELGFENIDWARYNLAQLQSQTELQIEEATEPTISSDPATDTLTQAQALYRAGYMAYNEGDYQTAIAQWETLLEEYPQHNTIYCVYCYLISSYSKFGEYEKVLDYLNLYEAKINSHNVLSNLVRGFVYTRLGDTASASADFDKYMPMLNNKDMQATQSIEFGQTETVAMHNNTAYQFSFKATKGVQYHITALRSSASTDLDPLAIVLNMNGKIIDGDDDSGIHFDADFIFTPSISSDYSLIITHAGAGREGKIDVRIDIVE